MPTYKTEAIIISYSKFKEADKIVRAYSPHFGIISAIAKGARKTKSRFGARLEPLSHCEFVLYKGRNLDIVTQIEILESFSKIRENLNKLSHAYVIADLILRSGGESDPSKIFLFFLYSLKELQKTDDTFIRQWLIAFQLRYLILSGYKPVLDKCSLCGKKTGNLTEKEYVFSFKYGSLLCSDCKEKGISFITLKNNTLQMLKDLSGADIKIWNKNIYSDSVKKESQKFLEDYTYYYLESRLKTVDFLKEIDSVYK